MKACSRCGETKPEDDFYNQKKPYGRFVKMSHCKVCHASATASHLRNMTPEQKDDYYDKMRARKLLATFGITIEQYDEMLGQQGGVCAICGQPETALEAKSRTEVRRVKRLAVDHDHETGKVRGLLCWMCNTRLGYFESQGLMIDLIAYLETQES